MCNILCYIIYNVAYASNNPIQSALRYSASISRNVSILDRNLANELKEMSKHGVYKRQNLADRFKTKKNPSASDVPLLKNVGTIYSE